MKLDEVTFDFLIKIPYDSFRGNEIVKIAKSRLHMRRIKYLAPKDSQFIDIGLQR